MDNKDSGEEKDLEAVEDKVMDTTVPPTPRYNLDRLRKRAPFVPFLDGALQVDADNPAHRQHFAEEEWEKKKKEK